mmetsp:Transcript_24636/g.60446  ORF Transcript_24636/g.60446 Transcript_24636/m.60446 type:complete len:203 (-) Transcript_24636:470-1078(-)
MGQHQVVPVALIFGARKNGQLRGFGWKQELLGHRRMQALNPLQGFQSPLQMNGRRQKADTDQPLVQEFWIQPSNHHLVVTHLSIFPSSTHDTNHLGLDLQYGRVHHVDFLFVSTTGPLQLLCSQGLCSQQDFVSWFQCGSGIGQAWNMENGTTSSSTTTTWIRIDSSLKLCIPFVKHHLFFKLFLQQKAKSTQVIVSSFCIF